MKLLYKRKSPAEGRTVNFLLQRRKNKNEIRIRARFFQKTDFGNSLEAQRENLIAAGAEEIIEECYTGTKTKRPKFTELINKLKAGDTLIVCKLDRFARTTSDGAKLVQELVERGVTVNILNMGIADNTPLGKFMINIMFSFAEFERDMIVERTQEGKQIARQREGFKEGRPKKEVQNFREYKEKCDKGELSITRAAKELGISRTQWYRLSST